MTIKLIVTCDDCGLSQGIDQSTAGLFERGMVSSGSVMTNFQNVQQSFELFSRYPNLELGVHLNLTDGSPITELAKRSDLVNSKGWFRNRFVLFARSVFLSSDIREAMEEEMRAQIEVFLQAGLQPAHLTTHIHFHVFPAVREIVYQLAEEYRVQWVRNSDFRLAVVPMNLALDTTPDDGESPHNFMVPDYLVMLRAYLDYPPDLMLRDILKLQGTVELVVHPSTPNDHQYPSQIAYLPDKRNRETRYLEQFFEALEPHLGADIQIVNTHGILDVG